MSYPTYGFPTYDLDDLPFATLTDEECELLTHLSDEEKEREVHERAERASGRLALAADGVRMSEEMQREAVEVLGKRAARGWSGR